VELTAKNPRKSPNGYIPVKFDDIELWYDPSDGKYFATIRLGPKKLTLEEAE